MTDLVIPVLVDKGRDIPASSAHYSSIHSVGTNLGLMCISCNLLIAFIQSLELRVMGGAFNSAGRLRS